MEPKQRIKVCKTCLNRGFDPKTGLICRLTGQPPEFINLCKDFSADEIELKKEEQMASFASYASGPLSKDALMVLLTALLMIVGFLFAWDDLYYSNFDAGMAKYSIAVYWTAMPILRMEKVILLQRTFYISAFINLLFFSFISLGTYGSSEFKFIFSMYLGIVLFYIVGYFQIRKLIKARKLKADSTKMEAHFTNDYYNV
ncbi:hypothetical protein DFO77_13522 [Marinilabilia salmonicolor]|uniref:Uncharacterized protein n=2 Tax=Marinilabilia salmonicolor TaxID=989 RepID=A0A368UJQ7_9BACT|nr:hypothetical protein [Marinilabilia salmonicolor]RCW28839.1 hypothetical protein DFO77_13522 [Marinilabilia salmonicolor]